MSNHESTAGQPAIVFSIDEYRAAAGYEQPRYADNGQEATIHILTDPQLKYGSDTSLYCTPEVFDQLYNEYAYARMELISRILHLSSLTDRQAASVAHRLVVFADNLEAHPEQYTDNAVMYAAILKRLNSAVEQYEQIDRQSQSAR